MLQYRKTYGKRFKQDAMFNYTTEIHLNFRYDWKYDISLMNVSVFNFSEYGLVTIINISFREQQAQGETLQIQNVLNIEYLEDLYLWL